MIHYSPADIEDYLEYEDPEGTMLAARKAAGLPPPIPLAEPWDPGPPILMTSRGQVAPWQSPATRAWLTAGDYPESTASWLAERGYPGPSADAVTPEPASRAVTPEPIGPAAEESSRAAPHPIDVMAPPASEWVAVSEWDFGDGAWVSWKMSAADAEARYGLVADFLPGAATYVFPPDPDPGERDEQVRDLQDDLQVLNDMTDAQLATTLVAETSIPEPETVAMTIKGHSVNDRGGIWLFGQGAMHSAGLSENLAAALRAERASAGAHQGEGRLGQAFPPLSLGGAAPRGAAATAAAGPTGPVHGHRGR